MMTSSELEMSVNGDEHHQENTVKVPAGSRIVHEKQEDYEELDELEELEGSEEEGMARMSESDLSLSAPRVDDESQI